METAEGLVRTQGVRRPALPDRMRQKYRFAVHEVGKALVATVLRAAEVDAGRRPRLERVERVSMVPRGRCAPCNSPLQLGLM